MRDILVTVVIFGLIPFILTRPQVGIYAWSWLSYMNPHRFTWGFAYTMPFAQIVAIASLISVFFWTEPKRIPITGLTVLWILFLVWLLITTIFAMHPELAWAQYERVIKIQLMTFLTIMVIKTKKDLNVLIWVIALSIGIFGIKGGVFTLQTLGGYRVWGPPGSYIEENNAMAVALLIVLPLFYYLKLHANRLIVKNALLLSMLLMVVSVVGSQSRGALIAISATGFFLWLKTPGKIISGMAIVILAVGLISFMPDSWHARMDTISTYQEDASAMGRINAWKMAVNLANHRVTGGGFDTWTRQAYQIYSTQWDVPRAAHSIYFSVLGEHGWIGLLLFIGIFLAAWGTSRRVIQQTKDVVALQWLANLCRMIQVSLIAYASGGAFLSLSYFDLPWHLVSLLIICRSIADSHLKQAVSVGHHMDSISNSKELSSVGSTKINE